eukprot:c38099_g1_i1 orf=1-153(-)
MPVLVAVRFISSWEANIGLRDCPLVTIAQNKVDQESPRVVHPPFSIEVSGD